MEIRPLLERLERSLVDGELADARPALATLASDGVSIDESELRGPRRRAVLLLATGGDPRLGVDLDGRAVTALAGELAAPARSAQLAVGVDALRGHAAGLGLVAAALDELAADPDLAWRAFAAALLLEELSE